MQRTNCFINATDVNVVLVNGNEPQIRFTKPQALAYYINNIVILHNSISKGDETIGHKPDL